VVAAPRVAGGRRRGGVLPGAAGPAGLGDLGGGGAQGGGDVVGLDFVLLTELRMAKSACRAGHPSRSGRNSPSYLGGVCVELFDQPERDVEAVPLETWGKDCLGPPVVSSEKTTLPADSAAQDRAK
jgi:hypothetical protein